jgi:dihydrofolate reductase
MWLYCSSHLVHGMRRPLPTSAVTPGASTRMPKYVASRTLHDPLEWNAKLLEGDLDERVKALKPEHQSNLIISDVGELAHTLTTKGLVDEFWFWVSPYRWPSGPRIFDGVGPVRLELISITPYRSDVVWLRYRPTNDARPDRAA